MGVDKATLEIGGVPLWRRQLDLLGAIGASEKWLSMRADQSWLPLGLPRLNDNLKEGGPMGAIAQSMQKSRYDHLAVVAIDLPQIPSTWFRRIGNRCADGIGVVGQRPDGKLEPLAAIYPKKIYARLAASVAEGKLSLQDFLRDAIEDGYMRTEAIPEAELAWFENWNEPR